MGENSGIQWTRHTFNPWIGCAPVSPGCKHCYAELLDKRSGGVPKAKRPDPTKPLLRWGPHAPRTRTSEAKWREPLRWNAKAAAAGERHRVFCASMADVFEDRPELVEWREELWALILLTPHLDWQLLTKRPENIRRFIPSGSVEFGRINEHARAMSKRDDIAVLPTQRHGMVPMEWPFPNVWLGTTVEDQRRAEERVPHLLSVPAAVRFLSCEPLLEAVDLRRWLRFERYGDGKGMGGGLATGPALDWIIIGGESGGKARPFDLAWARSLVAQCRAAGVAPFVKQMGSNPTEEVGVPGTLPVPPKPKCRDSHGGDPAEWPEDLRVREFPVVTR